MDRDRVSARQLITLTFAALLSPAIRVLPGRTAQLAGEEGGWPPWPPCRRRWGCAGCCPPC